MRSRHNVNIVFVGKTEELHLGMPENVHEMQKLINETMFHNLGQGLPFIETDKRNWKVNGVCKCNFKVSQKLRRP